MTSYRIPNTYQSPIGSALGNLMNAFASLPSPEERALKQAQVQNLQSQAALNQQKMADAAREAQYGAKITDVFRKVFTPVEDVRSNADFVGPIPEVPPDERVRRALPDLAGTLPPNQIGQLGDTMLALFANAPGTSNEAVTRAGIGAKVPYNSTQLGAEAERDRKVETERMRDERAQRAAQYAADRQAQAQIAVADRQEKAQANRPQLFADNNSPTGISIWAPGSGVHLKPGVPPQAASSLQNDAAKRTDALNIFEQNLTDFENLAINNPNALGFSGDVARVGSGLVSQGQSLAKNFGLDLSPLIAKGQTALGAAGIQVPSTSIAASQLDTYGVLIPRLAAQAFGEKTGTGFSNKDAERYAKAFGESPIANIDDLRARIQSVRRMLATDMEIYGARAGNKTSPGLGAAVTNTFQPPAAPAATPAASPGTSDPLGIRR